MFAVGNFHLTFTQGKPGIELCHWRIRSYMAS